MKSVSALILAAVFSVSVPGQVFPSPMVEVPAGPFILGSDSDPRAAPEHTGNLETFFIDTHEVTNKEFSDLFPAHSYPPGAERHPVSGVTWSEAGDYCQQMGKRLPTGAEWEKAARGPQGRVYPWGDKPPRNKPHPFYSGLVKRRVGLNKLDISFYGAHDMAGSVWEWTADTVRDKEGARGGLWNLHLDYEYSKTFDRILILPTDRFVFLGFRCARSD